MFELIRMFQRELSVSGGENTLADVIAGVLEPVADKITRDAMGNLIVYKKGRYGAKKVMIAAHMDEIGFVATAIEDSGMIRVSNIGGINPVASSYTPVEFENGAKGVLVVEDGTKPEDISNKKLLVDIGADNASAAKRRVHVGDFCACAPMLYRLNKNRAVSKAFDDRLGCAVAAYAALNCKKPAFDTYYVFTVQEELGCRGSKPAAFTVMPDYALAIDVTPAPAAGNPDKLTVKLGAGAAVKVKDSSVICSPMLVDRLAELAEEKNIKYQYEVLSAGGTDTSSMQIAGTGCHAACISIPTRYVHTPVETVDLRDVKACADLMIAFIGEGVEE
ncbi:MAG: M20/M25/M40 family metallo-hydrolase [Clostridia bacterium]|nr:M20/M25/M40 family metallo-hydrolase [Clostridia bacterium]